MRPSVLFTALAGIGVNAIGLVSLLAIRAVAHDRPMLGSWDDLIVLPAAAVAAWVTLHAAYGAEMNGRVNDANRQARAIKAALRESFAEAKADDPDLPEPTEEDLDRAAGVIRFDAHRARRMGTVVTAGAMTPNEARGPDLRSFADLAREDLDRKNAAADAELGGLKPPSDLDA